MQGSTIATAPKKNVLYIGAGAPWVGGAGYLVRQRMFLRALAEVANLHLAMFELPSGAEKNLPDYVANLTALPKVQRVQEKGMHQLISDLIRIKPRMFRPINSGAAQQAVAALHPERFDAVFAFRIDFAQFAGMLGHPRLLLDIDDPEHLRWRKQLAATGGGDPRTRFDLVKLARFEKRAVRHAMASFVCQEHDRTAFDPLPIVVPNCVDVPAECPPRRAQKPLAIFVGNFAPTSPNTDALIWFLADIWPLIRREIPDAEFHVIGKLYGNLESRLANSPGAIAAGFVPNLAIAMSEASLSVAPIRYGTGTRVKIIESFALGCPVVSTTMGCEGIDATHDRHLLIADAPADFAKSCIALLRDPARQASLAAAGYEVADKYYNEATRRRELVGTLGQLLEKCSGRATKSGSGGTVRQAALL